MSARGALGDARLDFTDSLCVSQAEGGAIVTRLYHTVMPGEEPAPSEGWGPASTSVAIPALQDVDTGPSPGMTWRARIAGGDLVIPHESLLPASILDPWRGSRPAIERYKRVIGDGLTSRVGAPPRSIS